MSRIRQDQTLRQVARQKADFRLIAANQILQKNSLSLRQFIEEELAVNPALELDTDMLCPSCGGTLLEGNCQICERLISAADKGESAEGYTRPATTAVPKDKTLRNDISDVAAPISLADHLRDQAQGLLPPEQQSIADYLIANIGEKGLLECTLNEVSRELGVSQETVNEVLSVLQTADPIGVGARSTQEALLIQLRQIAREREVDPWAEKIVNSCWEDLAYQRYQKIASKTGCTIEEVKKSAEFIRDNLNPYPASGFREQFQEAATDTMRWPDISIQRDKDTYCVEVLESFESELRISESFQRLRRVLSRAGNTPRKKVAALESLRRANFFLACLKMRKRTLQEVAECVVRLQRGFLDTGAEGHLRPLTRAKVASLLGKHESTVSRAVADKLVMLPDRKLIPFERFFSPSAAPKSVILELIKREAKAKPLTDVQISRILESRGYQVARRTVAKYRQALRIPPSTQRRLK